MVSSSVWHCSDRSMKSASLALNVPTIVRNIYHSQGLLVLLLRQTSKPIPEFEQEVQVLKALVGFHHQGVNLFLNLVIQAGHRVHAIPALREAVSAVRALLASVAPASLCRATNRASSSTSFIRAFCSLMHRWTSCHGEPDAEISANLTLHEIPALEPYNPNSMPMKALITHSSQVEETAARLLGRHREWAAGPEGGVTDLGVRRLLGQGGLGLFILSVYGRWRGQVFSFGGKRDIWQ
ncbi:hypothetical protein JZ751_017584 [Albula glossodonta]|uniref:Uncharacterized protein n=1 Tax=Albula glossodonta TaxID=121402 RepID=A0A8T2PNX3_9TELE|nr:hypothetical protein JZ751_017584 [Albula glossodonta]